MQSGRSYVENHQRKEARRQLHHIQKQMDLLGIRYGLDDLEAHLSMHALQAMYQAIAFILVDAETIAKTRQIRRQRRRAASVHGEEA